MLLSCLLGLALAQSLPEPSPPPTAADLRFTRLAARPKVPAGRLVRVLDDLVSTRIERASALEAQGRWGEALAELDAAQRRIQRAEALGVRLEGPDLGIDRARVAQAAVDAAVASVAEEADVPTAIARLRAALAWQPGDPAGRAALARLHDRWSADLADAGRRLDAAEAATAAWEAEPTEARQVAMQQRWQALAGEALAAGEARRARALLARLPATERGEAWSAADRGARVGLQVVVRSDLDSDAATLVARVERGVQAEVDALSPLWVLDGSEVGVQRGPEGPMPWGPVAVQATLRSATVDAGVPERRLRTTAVQGLWGGMPATLQATWEELHLQVTVRLSAEVEVEDGASKRVERLRVVAEATAPASWAGAVLGYRIDGAFVQEVAQVTWTGTDPRAMRDARRAREEAVVQARRDAAEALGRRLVAVAGATQ